MNKPRFSPYLGEAPFVKSRNFSIFVSFKTDKNLKIKKRFFVICERSLFQLDFGNKNLLNGNTI